MDKRINGDRLKQHNGELLVPGVDADNVLRCVERIDAEGKKLSLGEKKYRFFPARPIDGDLPFILCEGSATSLSVAEIAPAGYNVLGCFGAGNMKNALDILKAKYPEATFYAATDGDDSGEKAAASCESQGAKRIPFPRGEPDGSDWNDLVIKYGAAGARRFFDGALPKTNAGTTILRCDRLQYNSREHLIKGLLTQNSLNVVFGISGCAKTFFCTDMALSIASGQTFLGRRTMQGPVIYVCSEGADELVKRLDAWDIAKAAEGVSYKNGLPLYFVPHAVVISQEKQKQDLIDAVLDVAERELNGTTPVAVFLDTLARCSDGDENSNEDMSLFVAAADELRTRLNGPAVVIVHHTPKSNPEDMRGGSALRGALNTAICLSLRGAGTPEEQSILMICDKQKDLPAFPNQPLARVQVELPYANYYGEPETSCIIELREHTPETLKPLSPSENQVMAAFLKAAPVAGMLDNAGRFIGLTRDALREQFKIEYTGEIGKRNEETGEVNDATRRSAFKSGIDGLIKRGKLRKTGEELFTLDGPTAELEENDFAKKLKERWGVGGRCEALPTTQPLKVTVDGVRCVVPPLGGTTANANGNGEDQNQEQKQENPFLVEQPKNPRNRTPKQKILDNLRQKAPGCIVSVASVTCASVNDRALVERTLSDLAAAGDLEYVDDGEGGRNPTYRIPPLGEEDFEAGA